MGFAYKGAVGHEISISDLEFEGVRDLAHRETGIALGPRKRQLVHARLGRRLRALGLTTFTKYLQLLAGWDPSGQERTRFVNAITTNKTDFFREAYHFRHLTETWAPARQVHATSDGDRRVRVWSAGCSTGEEPYTIAMTLREAVGAGQRWDVRILASDIDTDALERAVGGVYSPEDVAAVPRLLRRRYLLEGTGASAGQVQVRPELRDLITFQRINLLDDPWPMRARFDVIFCRNVLI